MIEQPKGNKRAGAWALVATLVASVALGAAAAPQRLSGRRGSPYSAAASSGGGVSVASAGDSFAAASSGRGASPFGAGRPFPAAGAGDRYPTASASQSPARRPRRVAQAVDEAKRQRELAEMNDRLWKLEETPTDSLVACEDWHELNQRYIKAAEKDRHFRHTESFMKEHCDELAEVNEETDEYLEALREALAAEDLDQLEYVSALTGQVIDLRKRFKQNPLFEREFVRKVNDDPSLGDALHVLESFLGMMSEALSDSDFAVDRNKMHEYDEGEAKVDQELDELNESIRRLINNEDVLDAEELADLSSLTGVLSRVLSDGQHVKAGTAMHFYLSGTLNAANSVLVRKLTDESSFFHPNSDSDSDHYEADSAPSSPFFSGGESFDDVMARELEKLKAEKVAMSAKEASASNMPAPMPATAPSEPEQASPTPAPVPAASQPEQVPAPAAPAAAPAAPEQTAQPSSAATEPGQADAKPSPFLPPNELIDKLRQRRFTDNVPAQFSAP